MHRTSRRFQPSLGELELRVSPSMMTVHVATATDDDPGGNDPLPEPEPPPLPGNVGDPPLGWPPIPKAGPVGPG